MDIQRTIIIVALAIVSYMLVLKWNEDYGQVAVEPIAEEQPLVQTIESTFPEASTEEGDDFDTPEQKTNIEKPVTADSTPSLPVAHKRFVHVKTDVLDIKIDMQGGNIVQALLPDYKVSLDSPASLPLLQKNQERYYVVESGLFGENGFDSSKNGPLPVYQASDSLFELQDGQDELKVPLTFSKDGILVEKIYTFARNQYLIDLRYQVNNESTSPFTSNFSGKIVRDQSKDPSSQNSMGMQSFLGMVLSSEDEPYEKYDFDDLKEENINQTIQGGWVAFIQHYFLSAWIPSAEAKHTYQSRIKNGLYIMGFVSPAQTIAPGETGALGGQIYLGPKILDRLESAAPKLDLTVDYGILFFISYPLFLLLDFLYGLVANWGLAIILVTVIVKAVFFQLSAASYRSMANMRKVAPKLQALRERYGDDRQKMSQAMMDLYKKEKINPLGGCLPILVQMPVFIALYWVLLESVQLRHAPFFFWITDLSVKDPYFILPILMGISMFVQMSLNPTPPDPMQAKVMKFMPIMMTVFFLWFPAGLVLYWLVNNLLSIAQQWYITKKIEAAG